MAIVGIGIDVLEVGRVEKELRCDGPGFTRQVFSPEEIAECERRRDPAPHYAARFAAKEAVFKALATGVMDGASWREVEVRSTGEDRPRVVLHGRMRRRAERLRVARVFLALCPTRSLATASVVLES
jgi:holo-[acyl-carrier protein] synthase